MIFIIFVFQILAILQKNPFPETKFRKGNLQFFISAFSKSRGRRADKFFEHCVEMTQTRKPYFVRNIDDAKVTVF